MSTGTTLDSLVDQMISVITNDGRNIVGVLKGYDQATNIILDESHERVYSTREGVQQLVLGLYIIRGDNISVVGEIDEELDSNLDLSKLRAHPLKPIKTVGTAHRHRVTVLHFDYTVRQLMITDNRYCSATVALNVVTVIREELKKLLTHHHYASVLIV